VAVLLRRRDALLGIRKHAFVIAFVLAYLACYTLLYAWYVPVAAGNRLVLGLFLPFMYAAARVLRELCATGSASPRGLRYSRLYAAVHMALIVGVTLELHDILTNRIETVYGGD
jgi:hypothetical protein